MPRANCSTPKARQIHLELVLLDHVSYPPSLLLVRRPEALPDTAQPDIEKRLGGLPEIFVLAQFGDPEHLEQTPLPQLLVWLSGRREAFRLVLLGFEESEALPRWLIIALANSPVTAIDRLIFLDRSAPPLILPHRPYRYVQVQTLSVFPGLMIPLSMGSHQRAFLLAMHMAKEGRPVDFLITGDKKHFPRARAVLSQIGRQVHYYGNKRPKLPRLMRLRRQCEKLWRKINGASGVGPDLFVERLSNKANFSGKKKLRNLLEGYPYRNVVINYAWLEPIRDMVPASLKRSVRWYCDTHDVQFVRGQTANVGEIRFLVSSERERKIEIDVLSRFDRLIAISASDAAVLEGVFPDGRVIRSPTGFDYAFGCPNPAPRDAPVFGFIGGRMDANVRALLFVLNEWWPAIIRRWPAAVLSIAGAVSTDPHVVAATRSDARIVREGFVPSLQLWYAQIDCVLNPVIVQGGLNFKSVEAIFAGKVLITNAQGAVCINDDRVLDICSSGSDVVEKLESMWVQGVSEFRKNIEFRQAAAKEQFGDSQAYAQLLQEVDVEGQTQPSLDARSQQIEGGRVLIQCGDHFENRQRILGLAREVLRRGYLPVVLVYSREHVMPFLCQGVDAIALDEFSESWLQRVQRKARILSVRSLAMKYREFDIDDLTLTDQMHRPSAYRGRRFRSRLNDISRQVDRMLRVIDEVRPRFICVWNGYTGLTANILRQYAVQHDIGRLFMERSLFRHGVFVDPLGVNGFSSLAVFPKWSGLRLAEAVGVREPKHRSVNLVEIERLRQLPKWRNARRIIFIPLQVESDTNLLLHSSEIKSMYELVEYVVKNIATIDDAVVVRPHPEEVSEVKIPDGTNIYVDSDGALESWLEIADLVVTINSTVGLEALLTDTEVISLGRGVFTEFGLTSANPRRGGGADALWARMMDHTVTRDGRRNRVLDVVIPEHTAPTAILPMNRRGVDFRSLGLRCKADALCVREAALKQGQLLFVSELTEGELLDLTYRNTSIPWSAEWMAERLRDEFLLDAEVEVRLVRPDTPGEKALVRVIGEEGQKSSEDLFLIDKYGILRCDDFPPTNLGMMAK